MATQAYGFAPSNPAFVNGEYTIAVSDPITAAAVGTYRIARWIDIPEGVYNLKALASGAATLRIGVDLAGLTTLVSLVADVLTNTQVYFSGGKVRFDIELAHTHAGTECGITFLLYLPDKVIYASSAVDWMFNVTTAPLDNELLGEADSRLDLQVFSILPNWKDGITERVQFLTDGMISETGSTQTRSLRDKPRRSFEAQFMRSDTRRSRLDSFFTSVGRRTFMLPLWHEQYRPSGGLTNGAPTVVFPTGTLALREFRVGDLVFVNLADPDDYDLLEVGAIDTGTDTLTWVTAPARDWADGTRIVPMRKAMITERSSMRNPVDRVARVGIRFVIMEDDGVLAGSWDASQIWPFKIDWSSDLQQDHDRLDYEVDNDTGIPRVFNPQDLAMVSTRFSALFKGRSDVRSMRAFIAAARGRNKRFWIPSFTQDVIPTADLSGTYFYAKPFGFAEYAATQQMARKYLEFTLVDGSKFYREISDIEGIGELTPPYTITAEKITVTAALPATPLANIRSVRFMTPVRFDQDQFEMKHHADESVAVTVGFTVKTVDTVSGMPALPV